MPAVQSRFARMQEFAAKAMGERFAVLQYNRAIDQMSAWDW